MSCVETSCASNAESLDHADMMPMSISEIAKAVHGEIHEFNSCDTDLVANSVFSDSRQIRNGSVFVAIVGEHVDGHDLSLIHI